MDARQLTALGAVCALGLGLAGLVRHAGEGESTPVAQAAMAPAGAITLEDARLASEAQRLQAALNGYVVLVATVDDHDEAHTADVALRRYEEGLAAIARDAPTSSLRRIALGVASAAAAGRAAALSPDVHENLDATDGLDGLRGAAAHAHRTSGTMSSLLADLRRARDPAAYRGAAATLRAGLAREANVQPEPGAPAPLLVDDPVPTP